MGGSDSGDGQPTGAEVREKVQAESSPPADELSEEELEEERRRRTAEENRPEGAEVINSDVTSGED
jgi:hypothetical protein